MSSTYHFKLNGVKCFSSFNTKVLLVVSNSNNIRPSEKRDNSYIKIGGVQCSTSIYNTVEVKRPSSNLLTRASITYNYYCYIARLSLNKMSTVIG